MFNQYIRNLLLLITSGHGLFMKAVRIKIYVINVLNFSWLFYNPILCTCIVISLPLIKSLIVPTGYSEAGSNDGSCTNYTVAMMDDQSCTIPSHYKPLCHAAFIIPLGK